LSQISVQLRFAFLIEASKTGCGKPLAHPPRSQLLLHFLAFQAK